MSALNLTPEQRAALTPDQLAAIEGLQKRVQELNEKNRPKVNAVKVSEKGAVSVYGLNSRFPVTLYAEQWEVLLAEAKRILDFIKANDSKLSRKQRD